VPNQSFADDVSCVTFDINIDKGRIACISVDTGILRSVYKVVSEQMDKQERDFTSRRYSY
jgi:hypothetical protein